MKERIAFSETGKPYKGISVIFPAYNEEDNVERAVNAALSSFRRFFDKIEIIVVDDGSRDKTCERLDALAETTPEVVAKHHAKNRGYGAALRTGIESAQYDLIFFSDSDLQFDLDEIELLLEWIDHHDIVTGYRAKRADPMIRKLNAWAWGTLVKTLLGVKVRDIDCAFKLFHRHVFDGYKLESVGAMINTEILARAKQNKMTIKEVPVNHYSREVGEQTGANIKVIFKAFRELIEMHGKLRKPQGAAMDLAMNKK
ncbi:glycosyltransferase family 2 protein [Alteromonas aestuariivivens]|uniref:Glycosyltransferase family 2 protein n=2 Tax=Alteromonas aestuariivivens TaxID=1938339 RepID=A0A3D8MD48_9ALTE|nr:glycosyltransferase family 2 protein [Alteromonas aestuariivivens]